jgi:hypothetical protein
MPKYYPGLRDILPWVGGNMSQTWVIFWHILVTMETMISVKILEVVKAKNLLIIKIMFSARDIYFRY